MCEDDAKRLDIITSSPILHGKPWAEKVTCFNTVAPSNLLKRALKAGAGVETRERHKFTIYDEQKDEFVFLGLVLRMVCTEGKTVVSFYEMLKNVRTKCGCTSF